MPFTPSHAAAALPFLRSGLPPAALVLGTMAPDLLYYAPIEVPRGLSHSLLGAVTLDLALALLLFGVWRGWLRDPVADLLPAPLRVRVPPARRRVAAREWLPATGAALIGIATHLGWDAFTHRGAVASALGLEREVLGLPITSLLQHGSTVAGALVLVAWAVHLVRRTPRAEPASPSRLGARSRAVALGALLGLFATTALLVWAAGGLRVEPQLVFRVATTAVGVLVLGTAAYAAWWRLVPRGRG
ncbi:DUF4184 family protein [Homoserinibacter sp. YIM 151385]|uniref:DUF4184 family protein n=1 Tax=Homoserinibacter sp. YIM 151385 TaxID=2985506 RepID=UPI0022F01070|nr:DUF4184 family protein [Homoserinibacter sp. YIM 151385]WBU38888.1 DUF4184 family protein [Homoserinibacter sp. YIM 151385]